MEQRVWLDKMDWQAELVVLLHLAYGHLLAQGVEAELAVQLQELLLGRLEREGFFLVHLELYRPRQERAAVHHHQATLAQAVAAAAVLHQQTLQQAEERAGSVRFTTGLHKLQRQQAPTGCRFQPTFHTAAMVVAAGTQARRQRQLLEGMQVSMVLEEEAAAQVVSRKTQAKAEMERKES